MGEKMKGVPEINSHEFAFFPINDGHPQQGQSKQEQYYSEFRRVYETAYRIDVQLQKQKLLKRELAQRLAKLQVAIGLKQKKMLEPRDKLPEKKVRHRRRMRRLADQIQRPYKCNVQFCQRFYGSEGSLQQHIKLKHPELYQPNKAQP